MRTKMLLISCLLVFVLGCNLFSSVNAITFDIGNKISESEFTHDGNKLIYFDSGIVLYTKSDYIDYIPLILDGNKSTGIDHNFGPSHGWMDLDLLFPYAFNVSNITIMPMFNGSSSNYTLQVFYGGTNIPKFADEISTQEVFHINCTINGIRIELNNGNTNHFYFNDVIINYTINLTDLNSVNQALNILQNSINSLQNQINNLANQFNEFNNLIIELNSSISDINQTQKQILENITSLWTIYDGLNSSLNQLKTDIDNLNLTLYQNITQLENAIIIIEQDISNIQNNLDNLILDVNKIPALQDQINKTIKDINNLNNNLIALEASIPSEYNDTALSNRVFQLESENAKHIQEISNLTSEIDTLNMEINDLNTELDTLKSDLDNIKEQDDDEDEDEDGAEVISALAYGGIGLGILGVIIALAAIGMLMKRKSPPQMPPEVKEEPAPRISPEQPQITEGDVQTLEAQPQTSTQPPPQEQPPPLEEQQ